MAVWDSSDDSDIQYTAVDAGTDTLTLLADQKLLLWSGKTFEPNGNVTLSGGGGGGAQDGTLEAQTNAVFRAKGTESMHQVNIPVPVATKEELPPLPLPRVRTVTTNGKTDFVVPEDLQAQIKELAPLARTYRSRMASTSAAAVANSRLKDICKRLHEQGVSTKDLADLAGVTYRAMYKRLFL
jgi:hypothetical protein